MRGLALRLYRPAVAAIGAILRQRRSHPGVTVVIVNYQSLDLLRITTSALSRFAPGAKILVVDNDSSDGSRRWLRASPYRHILLPSNIHHGPALDLGFWAARTEYVIALDVDAFPISDRFLPELLDPLDEVDLCGAALPPELTHYGTKYVHPCCLAMRRDRFISRRHTFRPDEAMRADTGQQITMGESRIHYIETSSIRGPVVVGSVFGDIVYHNFYGTRLRNNNRTDMSVERVDTEAAWAEAVTKYLK